MEKDLEYHLNKLDKFELQLTSLGEKILEIYTTCAFKKNKNIIEENLRWLKENKEKALESLTEAVEYCKGFKESIENNTEVNSNEIETNRYDLEYDCSEYKAVSDNLVDNIHSLLAVSVNLVDNIHSLLRISTLEMSIANLAYHYPKFLNDYTELLEKAK